MPVPSKLGDHGAEVLRDDRSHVEIRTGDGRRQQEGAGFNPVGDHGVISSVQLVDPLDRDGGRAGTIDPGPHRHQQIGQVRDLGLKGGVFDHGLPVSQGGRHHQGLGGAHAGAIEVNVATGETLAAAGNNGGDHAVFDGHLGTEGLEAFYVFHHRARADLAAAGQGDLGHAHPGQQGADAEEAGPQAVDQFVGGGHLGDVVAVQFDGVATAHHLHAEGSEDLTHAGDVGERRHIAQPQGIAGEQTGGHQHQG
jgi:hypothetical protein